MWKKCKALKSDEGSDFSRFISIMHFSTLLSVALLLIVLFKVDFLLDYSVNNIFSDSTGKLNYFLNSKQIDDIEISSVLILIVGALSTILAIVYTLSINSLERIADKYTPHIIDTYRGSKEYRYTLQLFVTTIILSFLLLLLNKFLSNLTLLVWFILVLSAFVLCITRLTKYFTFIADIINPIKFALMLKNQTIMHIQNNEEEEAKNLITTIEDIILKSLDRDDKTIATEYTEKLDDISYEVLELGNIKYLEYLTKSYLRILAHCINVNSNLRYKIIHKYTSILYYIHAMKKVSRFSNKFFSDFSNYLDNLFNITKEVIHNDDFELFKAEVNNLSMQSIRDPKDSFNKVQYKHLSNEFLHLYGNEDFIKKKEQLSLSIDNLKSSFNLLTEYEVVFEKWNDFITSALKSKEPYIFAETIQNKSGEMRKDLFEFYFNSNIHRIFLLIGAYCLFLKEEKPIEPVKYIRELWFHTNPKDADGFMLNETPVTSDIETLLAILFWGGLNNFHWYDKYSFERFHGLKSYLYQYVILRITYLREYKNKDLTYSVSEKMEVAELESTYGILNRYMFEFDELINNCDRLIQEHSQWSSLFPTKKIRVNGEIDNPDSFKEVTVEEQFENTKDWFKNKKIEFEDKIHSIEKYLPLDSTEKDEAIKSTLQAFEESSEIQKAVSIKEFNSEIDDKLEFIQLGYRPISPKNCFLKASQVDCSALWTSFSRTVAFGEINYFVEQLVNCENIEKKYIKSDNLDEVYNQIEYAVNSLKESGFSPSTILIPLSLHYEFLKKSWRPQSLYYGKFRHETVNIDESTKLEVVNSSKFTKFNDIFILDKNVCSWIFKPSNYNHRLHVEINEYEKDLTKVDLSVKTIICLKIEDYLGIKILCNNKAIKELHDVEE
jgi:hypothetical protein